jgi:allophanate hydrolase
MLNYIQVPAPLGIGTVDIDDGTQVKGFICEAWVGEAAAAGEPNVVDISHLGNWLTFIEQQQQQKS